MRIQTVAGTRTLSGEPPRSTAYYYADLERLKRKDDPLKSEPITTLDHPIRNLAQPIRTLDQPIRHFESFDQSQQPPITDKDFARSNPNELSEYVETTEIIKDVPIREVPPLRDRQWSLPEYHTPENSRKIEETYSTAGTFPMPEPKEKEPLLAELEVVGRLPLTQLESNSGVRRSRSWYLCCPNVPDDDISRESSWRYSSLRPVTAPPLPQHNGLHHLVATQSSGRAEDAVALKSERDALARALAAERARASTAARAHDARLAELHGVIAELVRRRAADKHSRAIPEEEVSDECESTTQPAGELDNDADRSRTEQNDTSSMLSPAELPTPQDQRLDPNELPEDTTDTSTQEVLRVEQPRLEVTPTSPAAAATDAHSLSERESELCLSTARCCQFARHAHAHLAGEGSGGGSCERDKGSSDAEPRVYAASPGRCESRQAKLASRVRLRRTTDSSSNHVSNEEGWCTEAAERLALEVCAQAGLREALAGGHKGQGAEALDATLAAWRARAARLEADCTVLQCALARATDTAQRLSCACAVQESSAVALCCALRAADRALETYDVLLALAETNNTQSPERCAAERVARQLLSRLEAEAASPARALGEPLLSPGPWLQHDTQGACESGWSGEAEVRLRRHAARLKSDTVALRALRPPPQLFSYHDIEEEDLPKSVQSISMAEMEAAVMLQDLLMAKEQRAVARVAEASAGSTGEDGQVTEKKVESGRRRSRRERHWLDAASETDL